LELSTTREEPVGIVALYFSKSRVLNGPLGVSDAAQLLCGPRQRWPHNQSSRSRNMTWRRLVFCLLFAAGHAALAQTDTLPLQERIVPPSRIYAALPTYLAPPGAETAPADSLPTAQEVVARYDKAVGGVAAIQRHTSATLRGILELPKRDKGGSGNWKAVQSLNYTPVTFNNVDSSVFTPSPAVRDLIVKKKCTSCQAPDTTAWLADLSQLQHEMSTHYANLEWAVSVRGIDLRELSRRTADRLRSAATEAAAQRYIQDFLKAFGDGHLGVSWPARVAAAPVPVGAIRSQSACEQQGYRHTSSDTTEGVLRWADHYEPIESPDSRLFPIGIIAAPHARIGVIRIFTFATHEFPELCAEQLAAMHLSPDTACAGGCAGPLERETTNRLTAALERQLVVLEQHGITALTVDVTDNGGGDSWVDVAMRTLTTHRLVAARIGFIRHPHWTQQLSDRLAQIERDVPRTTGAYHQTLVRGATDIRAALDSAARQCGLDVLWEGGVPECSLVVTEPAMYSTGLIGYSAPNTRPADSLECCPVFYPVRFTYREGVYHGPLVVLVDRETASAAEDFAATLADNHAAIIAGEPTYGAGCGFTAGGIETTLQRSGAVVRMPDCIRLRVDGSNEVDGVTPSALVPWRLRDTPKQRASRAMPVIEKLLRTVAQAPIR
jgi:peptidase S41-like protein